MNLPIVDIASLPALESEVMYLMGNHRDSDSAIDFPALLENFESDINAHILPEIREKSVPHRLDVIIVGAEEHEQQEVQTKLRNHAMSCDSRVRNLNVIFAPPDSVRTINQNRRTIEYDPVKIDGPLTGDQLNEIRNLAFRDITQAMKDWRPQDSGLLTVILPGVPNTHQAQIGGILAEVFALVEEEQAPEDPKAINYTLELNIVFSVAMDDDSEVTTDQSDSP